LFRLRLARSAAEIEQLSSVWDSLSSPEQSFFQTYRWNRLAAQYFRGREEPYFVLAESDNGIAIIPAVIQTESKTISFAGERLFDYRDHLAQGDSVPLLRAWQALASLNLPVSITAISQPQREIWERMPKSFFSRAPRLSSNGITAEEFAAQHSRAFSRLRKLERIGLRICQYSGESWIVQHVYEVRAKQSVEGDLFHDPRRVEFMVAACAQEGKACEVFTLEHGNTLAASLITFRDDSFRRFYTTYYDHRWARYSPGVSLLFEIARRSLEQGLSFDLMTGEQPYKMRIAQQAEDLFEVRATAGQLRELFPAGAAERAA
jgi:Acetyltransferase (GNAT) domain